MDIIRVAIVGDIAVGKTAYLSRHTKGNFISLHIHNPNTQYQIPFSTNRGSINFSVTESPNGNQAFDAFIVMFDRTNKQSFNNSVAKVHSLCAQYPNRPIIWLGNKVDRKDREVRYTDINAILKSTKYYNLKYYDLSAKSNYNFYKPFLEIAQKYYSDQNLTFVESEAIELPQIDFNIHNSILLYNLLSTIFSEFEINIMS
jgi:GTP-binding nuclear protein Ran